MSKFPENTQFRTSADFSKRLLLIMDDHDCPSNRQFAELVGVSVPVISNAVNFNILPSLRSLIKIADRLEISIKYLLGIDDRSDFIPAASPSSFYARLEALTRERNLNYGQLASKMDFPRTYLYEWIKESTLPSVDYILELSEFFNVTPDYLLGRTDYKN
ncbi:MAG: helix-turn-helix transcriptional regulator [Clostridia bacterium]|nr:helix-turn-helix transcriptional regulator [Clostridia bacterium]